MTRQNENFILRLSEEARLNFLKRLEQNKKNKIDVSPMTIYEDESSHIIYRVFGILKEKESLTPHVIRSIRPIILERIGFKANSPAIQIIGDSTVFSRTGTYFAKEYIFNILNTNYNHVIFYGLTGYKKSNKTKLDVNALISEWVNTNLDENAPRVIGNVVDHGTKKAIQEWGCTAAAIRNFALVYTEGEPAATFGDDVVFSDYLIKQDDGKEESFGICLEGGIQTFLQAINMLAQSIPIFALSNLRCANHPTRYVDELKQNIPLFSAAEFLGEMKSFVNANPGLGANNTTNEKILLEYRNQYIYNPSIQYKPEERLHLHALPEGREVEFEKIWDELIKYEVWKKLHLLNFVIASNDFDDNYNNSNGNSNIPMLGFPQ